MTTSEAQTLGLRGPVLCATNLSDAADAALRQAYEISTAIRSTLIVCHVLPEVFNVRVLFPQNAGIDATAQAVLTQKAVSAVRTRLEAILGAESRSVEVATEAGTPHAGILNVAERVSAGVIVMGPGATTLRVARSATVPVLAARPSPAGGGVLSATDFSDPALPAVKMGAAEARRRGVRFRIVHVIGIDETTFIADGGVPGLMIPWPVSQTLVEQVEADAQKRLADAVAEIDMAAEPIVERNLPAFGILDAANAASTALIVVGTRGRSGLARLALGSVAESVITRATCSVLAVPLHPA